MLIIGTDPRIRIRTKKCHGSATGGGLVIFFLGGGGCSSANINITPVFQIGNHHKI
jgi:hypothetical protein